ncbi:MAG: ribosome-inactivating family protein [Acetobacteraceae bacterium]
MPATFIQLGPYYNRNITDARRYMAAHRERGVVTVYLAAPITSPVIEIAIDGRSLYVLGLRRQGEQRWWEFEPDGDQPHLSPAARIARGPATYSNLGLTAGTDVVMQPWLLLQELGNFDGLMGDDAKKRRLLLLIFLVSEALRFDSVKAACYAYLSHADLYFGAPEHFYRNPADMGRHRFVFTEQLVRTVQNWRTRTAGGNNDIGLPWLG